MIKKIIIVLFVFVLSTLSFSATLNFKAGLRDLVGVKAGLGG